MWVSRDSDMTEPAHLVGKNVALSAFRQRSPLLAKGDLEFHYKVSWRSINWKLTTKEKIPLEHGPDVSVEFIGEEIGSVIGSIRVRSMRFSCRTHPPMS